MNKHLQESMDWLINFGRNIFKEYPWIAHEYTSTYFTYLHEAYNILSSVEKDAKTIFKNTPSYFQVELIANSLTSKIPFPNVLTKPLTRNCHKSEASHKNDRVFIDKEFIYNTISHNLMVFFNEYDKDLDIPNPDDNQTEDASVTEQIKDIKNDIGELRSSIEGISLATSDDANDMFKTTEDYYDIDFDPSNTHAEDLRRQRFMDQNQ